MKYRLVEIKHESHCQYIIEKRYYFLFNFFNWWAQYGEDSFENYDDAFYRLRELRRDKNTPVKRILDV